MHMGHLHLVLPALNLSILQHIRLIMFSFNLVDYPMSFLSLSTYIFFCRLLEEIILNLYNHLGFLWDPSLNAKALYKVLLKLPFMLPFKLYIKLSFLSSSSSWSYAFLYSLEPSGELQESKNAYGNRQPHIWRSKILNPRALGSCWSQTVQGGRNGF